MKFFRLDKYKGRTLIILFIWYNYIFFIAKIFSLIYLNININLNNKKKFIILFYYKTKIINLNKNNFNFTLILVKNIKANNV